MFLRLFRRRGNRLLFRYHDGRRWRRADPFRCYRALKFHERFNLDTHPSLVDEGVEPETSIAIEAIAEVFHLQRWTADNEVGLTDWEVLSVFSDFFYYLESLKKSTGSGLTFTQPTAESSSSSPPPPDLTTNVSSPSTSTPNVASAA